MATLENETELLISSIYKANRIGERTEPCLTPNMSLKKFENALSHLTHVTQSENRFIIISIIIYLLYLLYM